MIHTYTCVNCGKEFGRLKLSYGKPTFCTKKCWINYVKSNSIKTSDKISEVKRCLCCGEPIIRKDGERIQQFKKKKYCNHNCYINHRASDRYENKMHFFEIECLNCGKMFMGNRNRKKYCSRECWFEYRAKNLKVINITCKRCGDIFETVWPKQKYCNSCRDEMRTERDGSGERATKWRLAVYERDGFTCQVCGKHSQKLNAHHIVRWDDSVDLRHSVDNGISLCLHCHTRVHRYYETGVVAPQDLIELRAGNENDAVKMLRMCGT
jgi:hypothetical protein